MSVFSQLLTIIKRATGSKVGSIAEKVVNRVDAPLFDRKAEPQEPYQHGTSHKRPINSETKKRPMSKKLDPSSSVQLEVLEDIPQPCVVTPAAEHKEWYTKRPNRPTQSVKISPSNFGLTPCSKRPQPVGSDDIRAHAQEWEPMTCVVRNQELAGVDGCGPDVRFCYNPTKWDQPQLWSIPCGIPIEIPNCIGRHISKNCWKVKLSTVDFTVPELERFVQSGAYIGLSGSTALEVTEPLVTVDPT